ncbi:hypothetical protein AB0J83_18515 [Actinoplanes sp. NPDC049596]|uniref:hypothetical protein n=1 Tax=unclassified Actinoplanes TaxID=2626549 RepID=UPI003438A1C1
MTDRFDPNIPPAGPASPSIEGEFIGTVVITEQPAIGTGNLVIDRTKPFDIEVKWHVYGNLVPLWLTALSRETDSWVVTAYVESQGPGDEKILESVKVPVGGPPFSLDEHYTAKIPVPAFALSEENPGDPGQSGTYKVVVTTFLDSKIGGIGYDMMGYAEGPVIKAEDPR